MMKSRTFQACSLKHSIKKGLFYVQGKYNFFKSGREEVLPPSPPIPDYAPVMSKKLFLQTMLDKIFGKN